MDISGLTEANEYDLPVTVSVSKSGVETNYVNPGKVHVRVDRVESKDVPVEVNVTGTPGDGYRAGKPTTATKRSPFPVRQPIWRRWPRQLQPWMLPAAIPRWPTTNAR